MLRSKLADFDLTSRAQAQDPFPVLNGLREQDPVHWSPALGGWILTRYEDVRTALTNPVYSVDRMTPFAQAAQARGRSIAAALGGLLAQWVVFQDPPNHTRLRRALNQGVTSSALRRMEPIVRSLVYEAIDRMQPLRHAELISEFAYPLPARVIMKLIGVPENAIDQIRNWSEDLATFVGHSTKPDRYERAYKALTEMATFFRGLITERMANPRDDLISSLIANGDAGNGLTEDELVYNALYLLFAGHETTTNLIGTGVYHLLRHPEQASRLSNDPGLAELAVEELLRYDSPSPAAMRIAAHDIDLCGRRLNKGDRIVAFISAANRDPEVFHLPEVLDIERSHNPHLALGLGIHFCLGAKLARLEARIALEALFSRFPRLHLAGPEPEWTNQLILRGVGTLEVAW